MCYFYLLIYYFLAFVSVYLYIYVVALFLAMCSWVDVDPSEEYQYPEQPSSDQFEHQQEQFEEGKYNMNNTYHFKYIFILHFNTICL